ncbi:MAG: bacillithiol biosynthesis deacetylase BshB1 [Ignavibacteriales bacterium CG_4_9_14_3_um_filter_34_10]|nr:MAG: bacillithiol biosynthesis deacetylase BshB1 [Ignavibacteriales bacterium CG_4_9_14_3_um_filter_34_10]
MKLDILIFAAHPDDAELSMGGTIASLTDSGFKVGIVDLTAGELGTRGSKIIRKQESKIASEILKVTHRENLSLKDGSIYEDDKTRKLIVEKIKKFQPVYIFAPYFNDRHPDHIATSKLVKSAMFFSGVTKYLSNGKNNSNKIIRPLKLFYYMQSYPFEPSFVIDVTNYFDVKMKSVYAYKTQFYDPASKEPHTFISDPKFVKYLEDRSRFYGFQIGKEYGEAFFCEELVEFDLINFLKKAKK